MTRRRRISVFLIALVLLGGSYGVFCVVYDRYEEWCSTRPQRMEAERQARLSQRVLGYVSDAAVQSAAFRMTSVEYFGGHLREWKYADGSVVYRERPGMPGTPAISMAVQLDENQRLLLADIVNLIVKQELWNQRDLQQQAADGGEDGYEFRVGDHNGRFKIVNTDPPHLDIFRHKCWRMMESLSEASKKEDHNRVPVPDR